MTEQNMDSRWSHPNTDNYYGGENSNGDAEYSADMTPPGQHPYGYMQVDGYNQTGPSFEATETGHTGVSYASQAYSFQGSGPSAEVDRVAAPQGLPERVSKATFGTGGAYTTVGPPYVASGFAATDARNDLNPQANPHGWVDSHGRPNFLERYIDPRILTVTVENYDEPQAGVQQDTSVSSENFNPNPGSGSLLQLDGMADGSETYNTFQYPQEQSAESRPSVNSPSLIDQMTADMPIFLASAPMLTELGDVPFAPTRRPSTVPWSPTAVIEQPMLHGVYNDATFLNRQDSRSTAGVSFRSPVRGWSSMSDIGYAASTNTSWDPGANPTDPATTIYPYPNSMDQVAAPHAVQPRRHGYRRGPRGSSDARSNSSRTREDVDVAFNHLDIGSRPRRMKRHDQASPAPSEASATSSVAWTPVTCQVEGCQTQFTGQFGRGNLARHVRLVHSRKDFFCEEIGCDKSYRRQDALKKHCDKKHAP